VAEQALRNARRVRHEGASAVEAARGRLGRLEHEIVNLRDVASLPFPCDRRHRNFELRTLRVVTFCSLRSYDGFPEAAQSQTMRYDAIGCPLPADKELAALFGASSPIHAGQNGLLQPIARTEVSRWPPSYRRAGA
jgi:hypothetical protein